jgi:hypothetical protein
MSKDKTKILDFYDRYAKKDWWRKKEAVALALNMNPHDIWYVDGALRKLNYKEYDFKFCTAYDEFTELVGQAMQSGKIFAGHVDNDFGNKELHAEPLSFINQLM